VPLVPSAGVRLNVPPEQIDEDIFVTAGYGLTVMVKVKGAPLHPLLTGVTE
jgi:hypothetical protein